MFSKISFAILIILTTLTFSNFTRAQSEAEKTYVALEGYSTWLVEVNDSGIKVYTTTYPANRRRGLRVSAGIGYIKTIYVKKNKSNEIYTLTFRGSDDPRVPTKQEIINKIKDIEKNEALKKAEFQKLAPGWELVTKFKLGGTRGLILYEPLTIKARVRREEDGKEINIIFGLNGRERRNDKLIDQKIAEKIRRFEAEGGKR